MRVPAALVGLLSLAVVSRPAAAQEQTSGESKFSQPTRPTISRSASIQRRGVLQVEIGNDDRMDSSEFTSEQAIPLTIRYAPLTRLVVEADVDPLLSEASRAASLRTTAVGDTVLGAQFVLADESARKPATAIAYYTKLPTASEAKGLGTGRVDHRLMLLLTRKFGETDVDMNIGYLNVGLDAGGRGSGVLAAVSVEREFTRHAGYVAELSDQTQDGDMPRGAYALAALTYRLTERLRFDGGTRFGLTGDAPRFSLVAGLSVAAPVALKR